MYVPFMYLFSKLPIYYLNKWWTFFSEIVVEIYCNMANLKMQTVCKKAFDFAETEN